MLGRLTRRELLKVGAGAGALLIANPKTAWGAPTDKFPASRQSRLFASNGTFAVHSDLHNHSLMSDGATAAEDVFAMMRAATLDVAALTDHATIGKVANPCSDPACKLYFGISEADWQRARQLADASDAPGWFVAMRGFEWTTGTIGHVNVWFTEQWTDSLTQAANSPRGLTELFGSLPDPLASATAPASAAVEQLPETATMSLFYDWLQDAGSDGIAGFNHPNEYGNFETFRFVPEVVDRLVSCEVMNMDRDFMFWRAKAGQPSPINACLNAGWRVGLLGVSDEHEAKWGDGRRARGGLWVRSLTRAGVREAMVARRMYATFIPGLRLDAAANGVQMGGTVGHRTGPVTFDLDVDRGPEWYGRKLRVQVVRPGTDEPRLAHEQEVVLPSPRQPVIKITVPVDVADGRWAVLRITDPTQRADAGTPAPFAASGRAIAYASPFWFNPDAAPTSVAGTSFTAPPAPVLPVTGGGAGLVGGAVAVAAALAARRAQSAS